MFLFVFGKILIIEPNVQFVYHKGYKYTKQSSTNNIGREMFSNINSAVSNQCCPNEYRNGIPSLSYKFITSDVTGS